MKKKEKYSVKYFHDSLPEWKRKIDSIPVRFFYRPASFVMASLCARVGITANMVSYISMVEGVVGSLLFLTGNFTFELIGAILLNLWLVLDCTDGNLARCVKKEVYGDFADAISSYVLDAVMCVCIGYAAYMDGGFFSHSGNSWLILIGAFASISDILSRLIYHKYKESTINLASKGVIPNFKNEESRTTDRNFFRALFEDQFGMGGLLPFLILLSVVFHALDIITIYFFVYFGIELLATIVVTLKKTIRASNQFELQ